MKKLMRLAVSLCLTVMLVITFSACGKKNDPPAKVSAYYNLSNKIADKIAAEINYITDKIQTSAEEDASPEQQEAAATGRRQRNALWNIQTQFFKFNDSVGGMQRISLKEVTNMIKNYETESKQPAEYADVSIVLNNGTYKLVYSASEYFTVTYDKTAEKIKVAYYKNSVMQQLVEYITLPGEGFAYLAYDATDDNSYTVQVLSTDEFVKIGIDYFSLVLPYSIYDSGTLPFGFAEQNTALYEVVRQTKTFLFCGGINDALPGYEDCIIKPGLGVYNGDYENSVSPVTTMCNFAIYSGINAVYETNEVIDLTDIVLLVTYANGYQATRNFDITMHSSGAQISFGVAGEHEILITVKGQIKAFKITIISL